MYDAMGTMHVFYTKCWHVPIRYLSNSENLLLLVKLQFYVWFLHDASANVICFLFNCIVTYNSCCCVWTMIELEQHCQRTDVFKRFTDSESKMTCTCTRDYIYSIHIHSCLLCYILCFLGFFLLYINIVFKCWTFSITVSFCSFCEFKI